MGPSHQPSADVLSRIEHDLASLYDRYAKKYKILDAMFRGAEPTEPIIFRFNPFISLTDYKVDDLFEPFKPRLRWFKSYIPAHKIKYAVQDMICQLDVYLQLNQEKEIIDLKNRLEHFLDYLNLGVHGAKILAKVLEDIPLKRPIKELFGHIFTQFTFSGLRYSSKPTTYPVRASMLLSGDATGANCQVLCEALQALFCFVGKLKGLSDIETKVQLMPNSGDQEPDHTFLTRFGTEIINNRADQNYPKSNVYMARRVGKRVDLIACRQFFFDHHTYIEYDGTIYDPVTGSMTDNAQELARQEFAKMQAESDQETVFEGPNHILKRANNQDLSVAEIDIPDGFSDIYILYEKSVA